MRITPIPAASRSRTIAGAVAASLGIVTITGAERLLTDTPKRCSSWLRSDVCPVPSHFVGLFARFSFTSFAVAVAAITSQKNADRGAQSHSDSESDAHGAERALFDSIFRVINQVFRRAAALFDSAFCSYDAIVDRLSDGFLHAFDFGF